MKKRKRRWNLGLAIQRDYLVSKVAGDKCRKQAIAYAIKDERQGGRNNG